MNSMKQALTLLNKAQQLIESELKEEVREEPKGIETPKKPDSVIVLEIGHGPHPEGFEPGAVCPRTGAKEWYLNRILAEEAEFLLKNKFGYKNVIVTDQNDYLYQIGLKHHKCDVFISVHHNAFSDPRAQGAECLIHPKMYSDADEKLAKYLAHDMSSWLDITNRGVKKMSLSILSGAIYERHQDSQGVVLIEPYFITGEDVDDHKQWSKTSGEAVAHGVHRFLSS